MIDWSFATNGAFMVDGFKQEVPVFWVDSMSITLPIIRSRLHLWHVTGPPILNQLEHFKTCRHNHGSESNKFTIACNFY
jgi:hypothetical protein